MPKSQQPHRYRTLFLSDLHLGTRGCQAHLLLDFLRYPEWHEGFTITPASKTKKPTQLQAGDKLSNNFDGTVMTPSVVV